MALPLDLKILDFHFPKRKNVLNTVTHGIRTYNTHIRIHGETIASPPGGDLLYPGTLRAIAFTM